MISPSGARGAPAEPSLSRFLARSWPPRRPALYRALQAPDPDDSAIRASDVAWRARAAPTGGAWRPRRRDRAGSRQQRLPPFRRYAARDGLVRHRRVETPEGDGERLLWPRRRLRRRARRGLEAHLAAALARNVYGAADPEAAPSAGALAFYVASLDEALKAIPMEEFATGQFRSRRARSRVETDMTEAGPFTRMARIDALPRDGQTVTIEASPAERAALAALFKLPAIAVLTATLRLEPVGRGGARVARICPRRAYPDLRRVARAVRRDRRRARRHPVRAAGGR